MDASICRPSHDAAPGNDGPPVKREALLISRWRAPPTPRSFLDQQPGVPSPQMFLHDPHHFHIWQTVAHRFLYTDLVQNRLDEWSLDDIQQLSPDTVFVHGKLRKG